jgi:acetate---CoA ligase (ADP-forming)
VEAIVLHSLFEPRSVLLTGISPEPGNLACSSLHNLVSFGFKGDIHLLGRKPAEIFGHAVRTSWDEIPDGIDVAVILTPARTVAETLEQCGRKGIHRAIVQSAGFKELGAEGEALADEVHAVARRYGIRFTGPNGLGVIHPSFGFVPIFVPLTPQWLPGGVSIATQSGGMGFNYLYGLADQNVGVAKLVSMGNKLDLDEVDYVRFLAKDPETSAIVLYLEGIARGRELFEALRDCDKPVLVHKSGHTSEGSRMAFSHTAALAADDKVLDAMLRQVGATRVYSPQEVVSRCKAFALPPVRGSRVAIISRSGGHAVVAADCAAETGFELPPFSPEFLAAAAGRQVIRRGNPLDLGDVFDFDLYARLLEQAAQDPAFDAVILMFGYFPPYETESSRRLLPKVKELTERYGKPVVMTLLAEESELHQVRQIHRYPYFLSVDEAFEALRLSRDHTLFLARRKAAAPDVAPAGLASAAARVQAHAQPGPLPMETGFQVLRDAGIPVAECRLVRTAADLSKVTDFPVAAKIASARAVHKTDVGGVRLGIPDAATLAATFQDFQGRFGPFGDGEGVLVQAMAAPGVEAIVGTTRDPVFGPLVLVGLGGVFVEVLKDTAIRLAPVSVEEARAMIAELKGAALFDGVRGQPSSDVAALAAVVHAVSHLVADCPRIEELDLNPVLVHREGVTAVDVRIQVTDR